MTQLPKPLIGEPCNGCGLCCQTVICAAGSITLGLVKAYGERAPGPCPALVDKGDGSFACGMVERPKDYAPGKGGAHELRAAISIMVGAGMGCDDVGDGSEPDADQELIDLQQRFADSLGRDKIERALKTWFGLK